GASFAADAKRPAKHPRGRTGGDRAKLGHGLDGGGHELLPSLLAAGVGIPNNCDTFFWTSIISSARAKRSVKWLFSCLSLRISSNSGSCLGLGPRRWGASALRMPFWPWCRQCVRWEEYRP